MSIQTNPCRGCTAREPKCHITCGAYRAWSASRASELAARDRKRMEAGSLAAYIEGIEKRKKKM